MGSALVRETAQPTHSVTVSDFYIDRWPVTNAEYKVFVDATNHPIPNYNVPWCDTAAYNWNPDTGMYPAGTGEHPVVLVSWDDAIAYAAWAKKRLPTEAEWEFAARGIESRLHPWGDKFKTNYCNSAEALKKRTTPVGEFSPQGDTPKGVVDMVGNVWEWTSSLFMPYPYDAQDGRENPESGNWRVLRGASWVNDASIANAASRLDGDFIFYNNVGFRCVASAG